MTQFVYLTQSGKSRYNRRMKRLLQKMKDTLAALSGRVRAHLSGVKWYFYLLDGAIIALMIAAGVFFIISKNAPDPRISVSVSADGRTTNYVVNEPEEGMSISAFLRAQNVRVNKGDELSADGNRLIADGTSVSIARSFPVAVRSMGNVSVINTTGGTVGDALRLSGVEYDAADIKQKLDRLNIRANAALGQNFLCDDAMIEKIASAAVGDGKTDILEIGPGLGALTGALVGRVPRVTAVEIDKSMLAALNTEFAAEIGRGELTLIHSDILKFDISCMEGEFAAAGNLPYYITTPIVLMLLRNAKRIPRMVLMVQKEAARRFFAKPKDKLYGPLAITAQLYYECESLVSLTPASYYPQPDVDSEVVLLTRRADAPADMDPAAFCRFTESIFAMRRKTVYNNLKPLLPAADAVAEALARANIAQAARAEALSIEELAKLYEASGTHN